MASTRWPHVSCVIPVRNDADALPRAVDSILGQGYPGELTVAMAVAPSQDGSAEVAEELARSDERIEVVPNPSGGTASGLNAAIAATTGEVIARVDARSQLGEGYLTRAVRLLNEVGAVNVGGVQAAEGRTEFTRAVAAAMRSRFGAGDSRFHVGGKPGPVDTVYLGVFRRDALEAAGGFDESLVRNQDYELNIRLRQQGGTIYFDPGLTVTYEPRSTLRGLARQYLEYGMWKREVVRRHPGSLRWRQVIPPVAVLANLTGLALGITTRKRHALLVPLAYVMATVVASLHTGRHAPPGVTVRLPLVYATMHHAWGVGMLIGPR